MATKTPDMYRNQIKNIRKDMEQWKIQLRGSEREGGGGVIFIDRVLAALAECGGAEALLTESINTVKHPEEYIRCRDEVVACKDELIQFFLHIYGDQNRNIF